MILGKYCIIVRRLLGVSDRHLCILSCSGILASNRMKCVKFVCYIYLDLKARPLECSCS